MDSSKPNYLELVKLKIEYDSTLSKVSLKDVDKVKSLLDKKHEIKNQNGFFAEHKINKINKEIQKYIDKNTKELSKVKLDEEANKDLNNNQNKEMDNKK